MIHAIVPWMFIECGWSLRDRPRDGVWVGRSGARTTGHCRYGVPYRFDRLILLYLATEAVRQGPVVRGKPGDIAAMFGLSWSESATLRRLYRVVHCWYEPAGCALETAEFSRRIPIADRFSRCTVSGEFRITLSSEFYQDAQVGASFSLDIVRQLSPAELGLYLLQVFRLARGEHGDIAITGEQGAYGILPGAQQPATFRQRIKQYMARIRHFWPECPYSVSPDGTRLVCTPYAAEHSEPAERRANAHEPEHEPGQVESEQATDPAASPSIRRLPPTHLSADQGDHYTGARSQAAPTPPVSADAKPRNTDQAPSPRELVQAARDMLALLKAALTPEPRHTADPPRPRSTAQSRRGPP